MKKLFGGLAVAMIAVGVAVPAAAVTYTTSSTATTFTQTLDYGNQTTDYTDLAAQFALFDTQGGTRQLTGVTVSTTYSFNTTFTVTNNSGGTVSGQLYSISRLGLLSDNSGIKTALQNAYDTSSYAYTNNQNQSANFNYGSSARTYTFDDDGNPVGQSYSVANGQTQTLSTINSNTGSKTVSIGSADLNSFVGTGSLANFLASSFTTTTNTYGGGNFSATQVTNADPIVKITYTFAQVAGVPEPATWAMMIAGFGMVGMGLRRKGVAVLFN